MSQPSTHSGLPFTIAVHGGAGAVCRAQLSAEKQHAIELALSQAVRAGEQVLQQGGLALDAVVAAVAVLEDSEHFNAGKGSVLTHSEMVEMDASVMDGRQCQAGAVAGVRHIKNPVILARDVLEKSAHVMLVGEGAEAFAFQQGHLYTEQDYFFTDERYEQLLRVKQSGTTALSESDTATRANSSAAHVEDGKYGTVGAVALDQHGHLAAATSTGGISNKQFGRVGDSALIGCGTVAENGVVAVSTTGVGELFIRKRVAEDVAARMRYLHEDVVTASEAVIHGDLHHLGGEGGLIALGSDGRCHFAINAQGMYRAYLNQDGEVRTFIDASESDAIESA